MISKKVIINNLYRLLILRKQTLNKRIQEKKEKEEIIQNDDNLNLYIEQRRLIKRMILIFSIVYMLVINSVVNFYQTREIDNLKDIVSSSVVKVVDKDMSTSRVDFFDDMVDKLEDEAHVDRIYAGFIVSSTTFLVFSTLNILEWRYNYMIRNKYDIRFKKKKDE